MLDHSKRDSLNGVIAHVHRILAKHSIDRAIGYDDDLSECGLSSLDMVNLMLSVEAEFAIKIPDAEMTPANFRSIARIDALMQRLAAAA